MATRIIYIKKGDTTYVAEDRAYRDKVKGPRHERFYIGKLGPDGEIVYNKGYKQREKLKQLEAQVNEAQERQGARWAASPDNQSDHGSGSSVSPDGSQGQVQSVPVTVPEERENGLCLVGEKRMLDLGIQETGLSDMLRETFGKGDAVRIQALAYYSVCTGDALSNCLPWMQLRGMTGAMMSSSDVSDLLARIDKAKTDSFFKQWVARHLKKDDTILFDISSISSYSTTGGNMFISWGYNRDKEDLPQVNVALLSSLSKRIPLLFMMMDGSISDCVVTDELLDILKAFNVGRTLFTGDRGFYSQHNILLLLKRGHGFLIPVPSSVGWQKEMIDRHKEGIFTPSNVIANGENGQFIFWAQDEHEFGGTKVRCHIYYDSTRKESMTKRLLSRINLSIKQLRDGIDVPAANKGIVKKYITGKTDAEGNKTYEINPTAVMETIHGYSCWWILLDTEYMDSETALSTYRDRDDVEDYFDDDKNTLDTYRLRNHDYVHSFGKFFVQFVALVIMQEFRLLVEKAPNYVRGYMTWDDMLRAVCSFHETRYEGVDEPIQGTPTKKQRDIFDIYGLQYTYKGTVHNKDNKAEMSIEERTKKAEEKRAKAAVKKKSVASK